MRIQGYNGTSLDNHRENRAATKAVDAALRPSPPATVLKWSSEAEQNRASAELDRIAAYPDDKTSHPHGSTPPGARRAGPPPPGAPQGGPPPGPPPKGAPPANRADATNHSKEPAEAEKSGTSSKSEESKEHEETVRKLKARDAEVRAHEQAHKSAGGAYTGSISYEYQQGPDGQNYAVGGHVDIDTSPIAGDPSATITKMQQVIRAALAPADPSSADRAVAAGASAKANEARQELNVERAEKAKPKEEDDSSRAVNNSTDEELTSVFSSNSEGGSADNGKAAQSRGSISPESRIAASAYRKQQASNMSQSSRA